MKENALKQLEQITIANVKSLLERKVPETFQKIIVSNEQLVSRGNYTFVKYKLEKAERKVHKVRFPLFDLIRVDFEELEKNNNESGKAYAESDVIFQMLKESYKIKSEKYDPERLFEPFNWPLDEENGEVSRQQRKYYFTSEPWTFQEECHECNGAKYIDCPEYECMGKHEYECPECYGKRKVDCHDCDKSGYIQCNKCSGNGELKCSECRGSGEIKCNSWSGCGGTGYVNVGDRKERCKKCSGRGYSRCSECRDGIIKCDKCTGKGELRCDSCHGRGEIDCSYCDARGRIVCKTCYGDRERYGKVDCPICKTEGKMAQITYVKTKISSDERERIILKGDQLNISENTILNHVDKTIKLKLIYKKVNDNLEQNYDEFSKEYSLLFEDELEVNKELYPLIVKEEINYQIIPCIAISYKHILTNTTHQITIVDFWDNPEIIFHDEPEKLKQDIGNATKAVGGFLGKLFKTKGFKTKEDKRNEIVLLICLLKADGKIEEKEKIYFSEMVGNLNEFTNSEKQRLFDIMNSTTLPELTKGDVTFSSKEREQDVLSKLTELANLNGQIQSEKHTFIDQIKSMI